MADRLADGWTVVARSWGARLDAGRVDLDALRVLAGGARGLGDLRELGPGDVDAVLALDAATREDYPGGVATRHVPLTREAAGISAARRAWGVIDPADRLVALTYVDVDGSRAETDFTVVARAHRGRGLGAAVKAASVLALTHDGVATFRTGGAAENAAILAANARIGYRVDERWATLAPPV